MAILFLLVLGLVYSEWFYPNDPSFTYHGRFDKSDPNSYRFDWSGSMISVEFYIDEKTLDPEIGINLAEKHLGRGNYYNIYINGHKQRIKTIFNATEYTFGANKGWNDLLIMRTSEAIYGVSRFEGLASIDKIRKTSKKTYHHNFLFLGDSLTVGLGVLGKTPCEADITNEDFGYSYDFMVANDYSATFQTVAWKGKGLVVNFDHSRENTIPTFLFDVCGTDSSCGKYDFSESTEERKIDGVFVFLGANDFFYKDYQPTENEFVDTYNNLLKNISKAIDNENAYYFLVCGWKESEEFPWFTYVNEVAEGWPGKEKMYSINLNGILDIPGDIGCAGHPNIYGQQKWAKYINAFVRGMTGW